MEWRETFVWRENVHFVFSFAASLHCMHRFWIGDIVNRVVIRPLIVLVGKSVYLYDVYIIRHTLVHAIYKSMVSMRFADVLHLVCALHSSVCPTFCSFFLFLYCSTSLPPYLASLFPFSAAFYNGWHDKLDTVLAVNRKMMSVSAVSARWAIMTVACVCSKLHCIAVCQSTAIGLFEFNLLVKKKTAQRMWSMKT